MYILALNGSHNNDGNTAFLLNEIAGHLSKNGAECEVVSVHEAVSSAKTPFCVSCQSPCEKACYKGTMLDEVFEKVKKADFVIFGSPVYFGSMTAQMKAFFDKTRAPRAEKAWLGKPIATVTVGASKYGGQERTADHIHSAALVSGMVIVGNGSELGMGHFGVSAHRPACEDELAIKQCESLATAIIKYLS
ncbi:MAG: NAD(P)H-dependent oxidoreductase [Eubacteriales bacterium]|nr:NAD(P)H-dependent oxidoreductase [Eubacteriales bacterium]